MSTANATPDSPTGQQFSISRVLDAPRDLVWKAMTEADHLVRWWGPKGFTMQSSRLDLRPGGHFHYGMTAANGQVMWGRWEFREIVPPEKLVFISGFSDETGGLTRAPWFSDGWPLEVLSTMTLAEADGKTTLTITGYPINATEAERKLYESQFPSMQQGFGNTLDQLVEYLKTI